MMEVFVVKDNEKIVAVFDSESFARRFMNPGHTIEKYGVNKKKSAMVDSRLRIADDYIAVLGRVCKLTSIQTAQIQSRTREQPIPQVRVIIAHILKTDYSHYLSPIAEIMNLNHSTILTYFDMVSYGMYAFERYKIRSYISDILNEYYKRYGG